MAGPKVIVIFQKMVQNMEDMDAMLPYFTNLGKDHVQYGIRPNYYKFFEHVLIETFRDILQEDFNSDIEQGWNIMFAFIREAMTSNNYDE
jgi:hemoglobin-like flavoprotein